MGARIGLLMGGILAMALGGGATVYGVSARQDPGDGHPSQLLGSDFSRLRREALGMFRRGSPVAAAADGLKALGFRCAPARHLLANINAPTVECASAGRGYPGTSRLQVTVMARNGMVSDIAVGNGFDDFFADARTPDSAQPEPAATTEPAKAEH